MVQPYRFCHIFENWATSFPDNSKVKILAQLWCGDGMKVGPPGITIGEFADQAIRWSWKNRLTDSNVSIIKVDKLEWTFAEICILVECSFHFCTYWERIAVVHFLPNLGKQRDLFFILFKHLGTTRSLEPFSVRLI